MKVTRVASLCVLAALAGCSSVPASRGKTAELEALARSYVSAQFAFDQDSIRKITAPRFVEISPRGEVDERDAVILFYAREKRSAAPEFAIKDQKVRVSGGMAVVTQTVVVGTPPRTMALTQALTATQASGKWMLTSSQSTPNPPKKPK